MSQWHLYMIRTRNGHLYTGISTDVERRFAEHQAQGEKCAKYLRGRAPLRLVFESVIGKRTLAHKAEHCVKQLPKLEKEAIVRGKPDGQELLSKLAIVSNTDDVI